MSSTVTATPETVTDPSPPTTNAPTIVKEATPPQSNKGAKTQAEINAAARIQRQLDEMQATTANQGFGKLSTASSASTVLPITASPIAPQSSALALAVDSQDIHEPVNSPLSDGFRESQVSVANSNSRTCPCGLVFARSDHMQRHRSRNICSAGYKHPSNPSHKSAAFWPSPGPQIVPSGSVTSSKGTSGMPFKCFCGKSFKKAGNYANHRRDIHRDRADGDDVLKPDSNDIKDANMVDPDEDDKLAAPEGTEGSYRAFCGCGKSYSREDTLRRHQRRNACDHSFPRLSSKLITAAQNLDIDSQSSSPSPTPLNTDGTPQRRSGRKRSSVTLNIVEEPVPKKKRRVEPKPKMTWQEKASLTRYEGGEDAESEDETLIDGGTVSVGGAASSRPLSVA